MAQRLSGSRISSKDQTVDHDLQRTVAELLLSGHASHDVERTLAQRGVPRHLAQAEVRRAADHPYLKAAQRLQNRLQKRDWLLQSRARLDRLDSERRSVPERSDLPADIFFEYYYVPNRPVLLSGLVRKWPAIRKWSLDYFATRLGDRPIEVQWNRNSDRAYEIESSRFQQVKPLAEVIGRLRDPRPTNDFYVTANNSGWNREALAPLWQDVGPIPGYLHATAGGQDGFFWMGPKGTITPFHHDLTNNLLVQISGVKRVKLVASHDTPLMRNHRHCFSEWTGEDLPAGPARDGKPEVLACDIGPGDALFIPVGWWHHVEGLDMTIGMSFTNFAKDNDFYSSYTTFDEV